MTAKYLIFGATGSIGSNLARTIKKFKSMIISSRFKK